MKRRTLIHLLAMAIFLLAARSAQAATYYVAPNGNDANPGTQASPFRNIARGITAAAASGDTVEVAAGTYAERLTWSSKSLLLKGAGTGQSIIDGGGTGRCLQLSSVPSTARIEGFTVQNGNSGSGDGGGINLDGSSPTVANCVFQLNQATRGGGMNANGSSPTVTDCLFSGNSAGGGGLANNFGSNPVFKRCVFLNNSDSNGAGGMAIRGGSPTLENCLVRGNVDRGLVTIGGGRATIKNCTFTGHSGAAIHNRNSSASTDDSGVVVTNSIIWGNGLGLLNQVSSNNHSIVSYSDLQGPAPGGGSTFNISTDPIFINPGLANFRLMANSPCIDTGTSPAPGPGDFDGAPRVLGSAPDMGPYEFWAAASSTWFVDKTLGNDTTGTGSPTAPYQTVVKAINTASAGHRIYIKQGNYGSDRPRITKALRLFNWNGTGLARIGQP